MSAVVPFDFKSNKLPAHIAKQMALVSATENDALGVAFPKPPAISLDGKRFSLVHNEKTSVILDPRTDEPANSIQVVILRANKGTNRTYYGAAYDPDSEEVSVPKCFSVDGKKPHSRAEVPQATSCALCPHNQFGSAIRDGKPAKGKACAESKFLAVAAVDRLDHPMRLRVPPTSLKALKLYGQFLKERGVAFPFVVTKIGFDPNITHQQLVFSAVGFVPDSAVETVLEMKEDELVKVITSEAEIEPDHETTPLPQVAKPSPNKQVEDEDDFEEEEEEEEEETPPPPPPPVIKKRRAAPPPPPQADAEGDDDLEDAIGAFIGGSFDD